MLRIRWWRTVEGREARAVPRVVALLLAVAVPALAGLATFIGMVQDNEGGVDGLDGVVALAISPDGDNLYAVGSQENTLTVFDRNRVSGMLEMREVHQDGVGGVLGLNTPVAVVVSPDGLHVFVASNLDDSLAVFRRDLGTGSLEFVNLYQDGVEGIFGLNGANDVTITEDGSLVFVTGEVEDTVAVFRRFAPSDDLVLVDVEQNGYDGVQYMHSPTSVASSPDGIHVYVTADLDQAVVVFTKDPTQDAIAFTNDIPTADIPSSVTIDPWGDFAYVTGLDWVMAHVRDPISGDIMPIAYYVDGVDGIDGLSGAHALAITPVGHAAFVSGSFDNAFAGFSRDQSTGLLSFSEVTRDGVGGVDGLANARGIVVSPDSRHLYVAGMDDDAIAIFELSRTMFTDGFESGGTSAWSATVP